jgi:hypothetical protein
MEKAQDIDCIVLFINGKHNELREGGHGFAAYVAVPDSRGCGSACDTIEIFLDQVSKTIAEIFSLQIVVFDSGH